MFGPQSFTTNSGWKQACLSLSRGGLGLRSVAVHSTATYLGSISSSSPDLVSSHYVIDATSSISRFLQRIHYQSLCQSSLIFSMTCHNELRIANSVHYTTLATWKIGLVYSPFHLCMPPKWLQVVSPPLGWVLTWLPTKCSGASNGGLVCL